MKFDPRLEEGIRLMRDGMDTRAAATGVGVKEERFIRYLVDTGVGVKEERFIRYLVDTGVGVKAGERWRLGPDRRPRRLPLYTRGRAIDVVVPGYDESRAVGKFMSAAGRFRATNDPRVLDPYRGKGVRDVKGVLHPFETDANSLYRLMAAGPEPFEQIYRIVV